MSVHHLNQGNSGGTVIGRAEPIAHPQNCKQECPTATTDRFAFPA